jgi:EmrB/QacA subfamily drug resistance transporter
MVQNTTIESGRPWIIGAALMALFLGALDALIMSAAMPTIITDLGGLDLYAWVYSAYFLARAVSLPVFGKLSDLYATKKLFLTSLFFFISGSVLAGASTSMELLILARVIQGLGSGGIFALVYVVLSDISLPGQRAKTLALASSVWGISSLVGPTLGGFIVTFFSWRWIFFINLPLGVLSLAGIALFFKEFREKPKEVNLDFAGLTLMTGTILSLLILVMMGGRDIPWDSFEMNLLILGTVILGAGFYAVEKRAKDPILNLDFFKQPGFALGNTIAFCASFSIFSLFAYVPLFLQGALGHSPLNVGYSMLSHSLGWSIGSILIGRVIHLIGHKNSTIVGVLFLAAGCGLTLFFSLDTTLVQCFFIFLTVGVGMGVITLSTLLVVQDSLPPKNLGSATSLHQFSRTLGGTIGVGVCGAVVTTRLMNNLETVAGKLPEISLPHMEENMENLFQPQFLQLLPNGGEIILRQAVANGVFAGFIVVFIAAVIPLALCAFLPKIDISKPNI